MAEPELVERVAAVWAKVLDVESVPADVNFFDIGGDSILLVVLLDRLNELTDRELEVPDLFQHSTVRAQAELLFGGGIAEPTRAVPDRAGLLRRAERARPGH